MWQKEQIIAELQKRGKRITEQRKVLLDVILEGNWTCCKEIYYEADRKECRVSWRPVRPLPDEEIWFENVWKDYREDGIIR